MVAKILLVDFCAENEEESKEEIETIKKPRISLQKEVEVSNKSSPTETLVPFGTVFSQAFCLGDEYCIREYSDKAVVQSKEILGMHLSLYPYIEARRECIKLVVENERHASFATIDRMFFFLLQLTEVAEV